MTIKINEGLTLTLKYPDSGTKEFLNHIPTIAWVNLPIKRGPVIAVRLGTRPPHWRSLGIELEMLITSTNTSAKSLHVVPLNRITRNLTDVIYQDGLESRYDGLHRAFTERQPDLIIMSSFSSA